ncbi:MAG: ThuA domain-containing protein [Planctomycetota bacterium]|nr:ThuA domain-containing protein [Planctomycetota bacterium]
MHNPSPTSTRREFLRRAALAGLAVPPLLSRGLLAAALADAPAVKVVVLTGGHGYDEPNFQKLFQSLAGIQATLRTMDQFVASPPDVRDGYDVVLFYHMLMPTPQGKALEALEHLGSTEQGILVLHHALLAYPQWQVWTDIMGIADRKFGYFHDQKLHVNVVNAQHPITQGIKSWDMVDESYTMADAGAGSEILLNTDHSKSMKTLGWTRQYKKSRVFCCESGHDNQTWVDSNFREVLRRGLLWCAKRI